MTIPITSPIRKWAFALVAALLFLAACHRQTAPVKVVRVVVLPYLTFAPIFIAQEEGEFSREGLTLDIVRLKASADAIPALAQGQVDVVGGSVGTGVINAIARGARIRAVADKGYVETAGCAAQAVVSRPALASDEAVRALARQRPLSVAANRASYNFYYTQLALERAGVRADTVRVLDVPDALLQDALTKGTIDLATTNEPWITRMVQGGQAAVWRRAGDVIPGFQQSMLFYGPGLLDRDPALGQAFMRAYLRGVRRYSRGKIPRNLDILAARTGQDRALLQAACWPPYRIDGGIDVESVVAFQRWGLQQGLLDRALGASEFWDPRFVTAARAVLDGGTR